MPEHAWVIAQLLDICKITRTKVSQRLLLLQVRTPHFWRRQNSVVLETGHSFTSTGRQKGSALQSQESLVCWSAQLPWAVWAHSQTNQVTDCMSPWEGETLPSLCDTCICKAAIPSLTFFFQRWNAKSQTALKMYFTNIGVSATAYCMQRNNPCALVIADPFSGKTLSQADLSPEAH